MAILEVSNPKSSCTEISLRATKKKFHCSSTLYLQQVAQELKLSGTVNSKSKDKGS